MTREEFEKCVDTYGAEKGTETRPFTDEEYKTIEKVYTFHPSISELGGKKQIAQIYVDFGMSIIRDMVPRAEVMEKLENDQIKARNELERVTALIKEIREGGEI